MTFPSVKKKKKRHRPWPLSVYFIRIVCHVVLSQSSSPTGNDIRTEAFPVFDHGDSFTGLDRLPRSVAASKLKRKADSSGQMKWWFSQKLPEVQPNNYLKQNFSEPLCNTRIAGRDTKMLFIYIKRNQNEVKEKHLFSLACQCFDGTSPLQTAGAPWWMFPRRIGNKTKFFFLFFPQTGLSMGNFPRTTPLLFHRDVCPLRTLWVVFLKAKGRGKEKEKGRKIYDTPTETGQQ